MQEALARRGAAPHSEAGTEAIDALSHRGRSTSALLFLAAIRSSQPSSSAGGAAQPCYSAIYFMARLCRCRRADQLCTEPHGYLSQAAFTPKDSQGCHSRSAVQQPTTFRAVSISTRQGARLTGTAIDPRPRRRGDRVRKWECRFGSTPWSIAVSERPASANPAVQRRRTKVGLHYCAIRTQSEARHISARCAITLQHPFTLLSPPGVVIARPHPAAGVS